MRSVNEIKEKRDELKKAMDKIRDRKEGMINTSPIGDMSSSDKTFYFKLSGLWSRYRDQVRTLEYTLNEDSEMGIEMSLYLSDVEGFIVR